MHFNLHDERRVRQSEQLRQQHAGLPESVVVALQSGQHEVRLFLGDGRGERSRRTQRIEREEFVVGNVDAAIGAFG